MANQGWESCHGPGEAHVNDPEKVKPVQLDKVAANVANAQCQTCHNRGEHALWDGSQHENRNVKCADCHSVHSSQGPVLMRAKTQQLTCAKCHQGITNKQQRFNHMPVREGKMSCSSCHNVHGSVNVKLLRTGTTVDQSCTSCHTEKRVRSAGSAPVIDNCTCHGCGSNNTGCWCETAVPLPALSRNRATSSHRMRGLPLNSQSTKMYGKSCELPPAGSWVEPSEREVLLTVMGA
jgi:DmsE family decaheme c-type cytochrome